MRNTTSGAARRIATPHGLLPAPCCAGPETGPAATPPPLPPPVAVVVLAVLVIGLAALLHPTTAGLPGGPHPGKETALQPLLLPPLQLLGCGRSRCPSRPHPITPQ